MEKEPAFDDVAPIFLFLIPIFTKDKGWSVFESTMLPVNCICDMAEKRHPMTISKIKALLIITLLENGVSDSFFL